MSRTKSTEGDRTAATDTKHTQAIMQPDAQSVTDAAGSTRQGEERELDIAEIEIDPDVLSRDRINAEVVKEYAELINQGKMSAKAEVVDDGKTKWLVAGWHQIEACRKLGRTTIRTKVISGTKKDAILRAIQSNASHGLRRSNADKRKSVKNMLRDEELRKWAVNEIGKLCGVSWGTVRAVWHKVQSELGLQKFEDREDVKAKRGGKPYTQKSRRKAIAPEQTAEGLRKAGAELHRVLMEAAEASEQMEETLRGTPAADASTCLAEIATKVAAAKTVLDKTQALLRRIAAADAGAQPSAPQQQHDAKPAAA